MFTKGALERASLRYQDAADDLMVWAAKVRVAHWRNFVDLQIDFPKADDVDGIVVFNIRHNRYRTLTSIKYDRVAGLRHINGSVYIKAFMTHAEYDRWSGMTRQKREKALWPQS